MKKSKEQKEYIFAVTAIILSVIFLVILFYVKSSNADSNIDSNEGQKDVIAYARS